MDEYRTRKRGEARFQARLPESQLLHPARRFLPRILHHRVAVVAPIFSAAGQGRRSAIHDSPSQSRLRQPSSLRALSDVWRVRLVDESELSLVLDLVIAALQRAGYLKNVVTLEHYHIMGKWMFAFCVFWAYIGFGQYMLIWYANMPEETQYYLTRNRSEER